MNKQHMFRRVDFHKDKELMGENHYFYIGTNTNIKKNANFTYIFTDKTKVQDSYGMELSPWITWIYVSTLL